MSRVCCVVACLNSIGEPDFYFCVVRCSQEQFDEGEHRNIAEAAAENEGYEKPMVTFDEGPDFLSKNFEWDTAPLVSE